MRNEDVTDKVIYEVLLITDVWCKQMHMFVKICCKQSLHIVIIKCKKQKNKLINLEQTICTYYMAYLW